MTILAIIAALGLVGYGALVVLTAQSIRYGNPSNERVEIAIKRQTRILLVRGSVVDTRA